MRKPAGEALVNHLTDRLAERLADQLSRITGLPTRDGITVRIDPRKKSVWVGYRGTF